MSSRNGFVVMLAIAATAVLLAWPAQPAARATNLGLTVTGFDDDGAATCPDPKITCESLRAAVKQANSDSSGEHLIDLAAGT